MENTKKGGIRITGNPDPILIILSRVPRIFPLTGTWDNPIGVCPVRPANEEQMGQMGQVFCVTINRRKTHISVISIFSQIAVVRNNLSHLSLASRVIF